MRAEAASVRGSELDEAQLLSAEEGELQVPRQLVLTLEKPRWVAQTKRRAAESRPSADERSIEQAKVVGLVQVVVALTQSGSSLLSLKGMVI